MYNNAAGLLNARRIDFDRSTANPQVAVINSILIGVPSSAEATVLNTALLDDQVRPFVMSVWSSLGTFVFEHVFTSSLLHIRNRRAPYLIYNQ